jgi:hypothetical protein
MSVFSVFCLRIIFPVNTALLVTNTHHRNLKCVMYKRPACHGRSDKAMSGRDQRQAKASLELRQSFVDTSCQETKTRKDVDTVGSRPIQLIICCRLVATGWSSLHLLRSKVVISSGASDELRPGGPSLFH